MRHLPAWSRSAVAALCAAVLLTGCEFDGAYDLPLPGGPVDEDSSYLVVAEFADVMNVVPKSPVMVDDVTVGEVTDVERVGWEARLELRIRDDVELPDNAVADIRQTSLLGEKYVALEAPAKPSPERLGEGDVIPREVTGRNPEVEEVLGALSFLLSGGGVGQLGTITTEVNKVMSGRTDDLRALLGSLDDVVGTIDDQKADIVHALESMNNLAATLNKERRTIGEALDVMGPAVAVLNDQQAELMKMLVALDELGVVGTRVLGASKDDLIAILADLRPVLTRLNEAGEALPRGLSLMLSFPFPEEAREIVKGDYANAEIKMDISLENFIGAQPLPNPVDLTKEVRECLKSGNATSAACLQVLRNADLQALLVKTCKEGGLRQNAVCQAVLALPKLPAPGDLGGLLDGLGGLTGVAGLRQALTSARGVATTSDLYGGAL